MIQTQVRIRTPCETDAQAVHAFLAGLSPNSQYQRFFTGLGTVSPSLVRELTTVTPRQQIVLATLDLEVVGHAMASVNKDGAIELGVVVADSHRHQGIATVLMRTLIERSVLAGVETLRFDVLCENQLVLDWIRRSLPGTTFERDGYTLTGYAPLSIELVRSPAA